MRSTDEFERNTVSAEDELIVYTWMDATLKELSDLIKEVHEDSRRKDAHFSFRSLFHTPYGRGRVQSKDLGVVYNGRASRDDEVSLEDKRFRQGDLLDVAIYLGPAGIAPPEMDRVGDRPF